MMQRRAFSRARAALATRRWLLCCTLPQHRRLSKPRCPSIPLTTTPQKVLPPKALAAFPAFARDALAWHIKAHRDHLVRDNPTWFVAFVWCEVLLQLPFFFVAAYAYAKGKAWIRTPAIMYGVHAATTVVPMLAEFHHGDGGRAAANPQRALLLAMYGAYLVVPLALALDMALRREPFPAAGASKRRKAA